MGRPIRDLTGQRYGHMTVLRYEGTHVSRGGFRQGSLWLCRCDCGRMTVVMGKNLLSGNTRSCGCRQIDGIRRYWAGRRRVAEA